MDEENTVDGKHSETGSVHDTASQTEEPLVPKPPSRASRVLRKIVEVPINAEETVKNAVGRVNETGNAIVRPLGRILGYFIDKALDLLKLFVTIAVVGVLVGGIIRYCGSEGSHIGNKSVDNIVNYRKISGLINSRKHEVNRALDELQKAGEICVKETKGDEEKGCECVKNGIFTIQELRETYRDSFSEQEWRDEFLSRRTWLYSEGGDTPILESKDRCRSIEHFKEAREFYRDGVRRLNLRKENTRTLIPRHFPKLKIRR